MKAGNLPVGEKRKFLIDFYNDLEKTGGKGTPLDFKNHWAKPDHDFLDDVYNKKLLEKYPDD